MPLHGTRQVESPVYGQDAIAVDGAVEGEVSIDVVDRGHRGGSHIDAAGVVAVHMRTRSRGDGVHEGLQPGGRRHRLPEWAIDILDGWRGGATRVVALSQYRYCVHNVLRRVGGRVGVRIVVGSDGGVGVVRGFPTAVQIVATDVIDRRIGHVLDIRIGPI